MSIHIATPRWHKSLKFLAATIRNGPILPPVFHWVTQRNVPGNRQKIDQDVKNCIW